jgi:flap endonuclease-1
LINDFGVPYIQASGEGEAQAAYLVQNDDAWGVVSEDYDTLLFGGTRLLYNFSITKNTKNDTEIEYISLPKMLIDLKLRREQLVDMAILIGTDYNQGIKWVGQHTALKLIKKHGTLEKVINAGEEVRGKEIYVNTEIIKGIRDIYLNPSLKTDYGPLEWNKIRFEKLKERMINKHDFSQKRIGNGIKRLKEKIKE